MASNLPEQAPEPSKWEQLHGRTVMVDGKDGSLPAEVTIRFIDRHGLLVMEEHLGNLTAFAREAGVPAERLRMTAGRATGHPFAENLAEVLADLAEHVRAAEADQAPEPRPRRSPLSAISGRRRRRVRRSGALEPASSSQNPAGELHSGGWRWTSKRIADLAESVPQTIAEVEYLNDEHARQWTARGVAARNEPRLREFFDRYLGQPDPNVPESLVNCRLGKLVWALEESWFANDIESIRNHPFGGGWAQTLESILEVYPNTVLPGTAEAKLALAAVNKARPDLRDGPLWNKSERAELLTELMREATEAVVKGEVVDATDRRPKPRTSELGMQPDR
jgi:hypothetical protein